MWRKIGGSLIIIGLCLGLSAGPVAQAKAATSHVGVTLIGRYDPPVTATKPLLPGTGKVISPLVGTLPATGDEMPIGEIIGGLLLLLFGFYLYRPLHKLRKVKRINDV